MPACPAVADTPHLELNFSNYSFFMKISKPLISILCLIPFLTSSASACGSSAIYAAMEAHGESATGWFTAAAGQYSSFGTTQVDGDEIPNMANQHLDSTILQAVAGYNFTPRFSMQLNLPYAYRSYDRPQGFQTDRGVEQGIGDVSLVGRFLIMRQDKPDTNFVWNALAGLKLPTGSSSRIKEEFSEIEVPGAPESGIHGHDLALGSGSWDGIVGASTYYRYQRTFATASVQYSLRTTGDYGYRYANTLSWEVGAGGYLLLEHQGTLALELVISGDCKGTDTFQGQDAIDTGMNAIYLGPKIIGTWGEKLSADFGVDLPVRLQNTALQAVPDLRIRGGITWRF
jgi:hypothetical protein